MSIGMLVVGLVRGGEWEPPDEPPAPRPRRPWRPPWRALGGFALWCSLFVIAGVVDHAVGSVAAYCVLLLAVAIGGRKLDRWCARQHWSGLRDFRL